MLYVGTSYRLRMLAVISYNYRDRWIELSNAVNQILKLVITQKCFCSNGDKCAYVVFCKMRKVKINETQLLFILKTLYVGHYMSGLAWITSFRSSRSRIIELRRDFMSNFNGEGCLEPISPKLHWFIKIKD